METVHLILSIFQVILAVGIIVIIVLQQSKQEGLSGALAGSSDTFFGKNKDKGFEALLNKLTIIGSIVFAIVTILLNIV